MVYFLGFRYIYNLCPLTLFLVTGVSSFFSSLSFLASSSFVSFFASFAFLSFFLSLFSLFSSSTTSSFFFFFSFFAFPCSYKCKTTIFYKQECKHTYLNIYCYACLCERDSRFAQCMNLHSREENVLTAESDKCLH